MCPVTIQYYDLEPLVYQTSSKNINFSTLLPLLCICSRCCCSWVLRHSLRPQVISVAFYIVREKSNKFSSEALFKVWGSFTCRNVRHGTYSFTSLPKEVTLRIFTLFKRSIDPGRVWTLKLVLICNKPDVSCVDTTLRFQVFGVPNIP